MHSLPDKAWRNMIAVNVVVTALVFVHKVAVSVPSEQYTQLLSDYHFGFIRRALVGAIVGLFFPVLPQWAPYLVGGMVWLVVLALFLRLFDRTFGLNQANLPLLVFTAGSPFFLKNFVQTLGYFDIYGCLLALALLLAPSRSRLYVLAAGAGTIVLIAIHHIHMVMYVPTIVVIVVFRHHLARPIAATDLLLGAALLAVTGVVFLAAQFYGTVPGPELEAYLRTRMTDPSRRLTPYLYTRTLTEELADTWTALPGNASRFPVYALLIALHWPLIAYMRRTIRGLRESLHIQLVYTAIVLVSLGYVVILVVAFDYARFVSDWATCMLLLLFAVKTLPARDAPAFVPDEPTTRRLGWIISIIPRVGTTKPF